jgi:hypothetical protein
MHTLQVSAVAAHADCQQPWLLYCHDDSAAAAGTWHACSMHPKVQLLVVWHATTAAHLRGLRSAATARVQQSVM